MTRNDAIAYARGRERQLSREEVCRAHGIPVRTFNRLAALGRFGQVLPIGDQPHVAASAVQAYADRTLTVKQAMGRTGLSKSELHRRKEMGEFGKYRKVGRHHLLFEIQVEAWLDRQVVDPLM